MSQVVFETQLLDGRPVRVQAGWDESLQGYHFGIFDLSEGAENTEDSGIIWDNLEHCHPIMSKTIDEFLSIPERFGIEPPPNFWEEMKQKKGNVLIYWKENHWHESAR